MGYDDWKTTPPDDNPYGDEPPDLDECEVCGARGEEPCEADCNCLTCQFKRALEIA